MTHNASWIWDNFDLDNGLSPGGTWRHQAIALINFDLLSVRRHDIHLRQFHKNDLSHQSNIKLKYTWKSLIWNFIQIS